MSQSLTHLLLQFFNICFPYQSLFYISKREHNFDHCVTKNMLPVNFKKLFEIVLRGRKMFVSVLGSLLE